MVRLLPFLLLALWFGPAHARPPLEGIVKDASSNNLVAPNGISLKQATAIARSETGGRVLSAKPYRRGGAVGYQVRLLIDGERVVNVIVDADGRVKTKK